MKINKMIVQGSKQPLTQQEATDYLLPVNSFNLRTTTRGQSERHEIELQEDSVIELVFEDDTVWLCDQDTIQEIFPQAQVRSAAGDVFEIPLAIQETSERGIIGNIFVKVVNIFARKKIDAQVKKMAADLELKILDHNVGLYRLDSNFALKEFKPEPSSQPFLLFLHGTAASTQNSFGGLKDTPAWTYCVDTFKDNIITFQHESLTKGPFENVLDLVTALPANCTLHIISQSHGGLVGDVLSRFCNGNQNNSGFTADEIKYLRKEGRTEEVRRIEAIKTQLEKKKIIVQKFIRVACPAAGSTLASTRLDNFFNVLFNLIGLGTGWAGSPLYIAFKNLLAAVINSKNDPDILPGVEALNPQSPFIKMLNAPDTTVILDNPLIVIAGNARMKFNLKALLVILTRLFFKQRNDMVVNTSSMHKGARRAPNRIQLFVNESADVDHFHYFKNKRTTDAILKALQTTAGDPVPGFEFIDQAAPELDRNVLLKLQMGETFEDSVSGTRPILLLLPGIMGSNLAKGNKEDSLIWIRYRNFLKGKLIDMDIENSLSAPSLIRTSYQKFVEYLQRDYDVVTFPFDWRLQLEDTAALLNTKINALLKFNQPLKVIGHSMGGVLFRDFIVTYPQTWTRLNASPGFKMIFLGAPLGGSFRIPCVLFGLDGVIKKLSLIDIHHTKKELLTVFSRFPGILSLLPFSSDAANNFADPQLWDTMKSALLGDDENWPLPVAKDLKVFKDYREKMQAGMEEIDFSNITYVAGQDEETICGYEIIETNKGKKLQFLKTGEGDASVTWATGIPRQMINTGTVYYVNVTHGELANDSSIFDGLAELITAGKTTRLSRNRPQIKAAKKLFRSIENESSTDLDISEEGVKTTLLGLNTSAPRQVKSDTVLNVSVAHGDLRDASFPVLTGHFESDGILYAEKIIDESMGRLLSLRHGLGLYPGPMGSSEVLLSDTPGFKGTVIVGMGLPGTLTANQLALAVEQGIANYLLRLNDKNNQRLDAFFYNGKIGISALVIGCGYGGLSIEESVKAILQGITRANEKIARTDSSANKVEWVEFIELYKTRALTAYYALSKLEAERTSLLNLAISLRTIKTKLGARDSLPMDLKENWWTRISLQLDKSAKDDCVQRLRYSVATGNAREEKHILNSSRMIIDKLIEEMSTDNHWTPALAKTIFELLVPNGIKEQFRRQGPINWIVDEATAAYPWELLQDSAVNARPLAVNAGMIRQLSTEQYRTKIDRVNNNKVLVVADPQLNGFAQQLEGAFKEGQMVANLFDSRGFDVSPILKGNYTSIIQTLFSTDFKIIHLAGHGVFNPDPCGDSGMLLGDKIFLSTREINQMSSVPEFVFVNCCFLGKTNASAEELYSHRYKLAANIGTQLIQNGVKAVIAAGWAVQDDAALEFSQCFYEKMFAGASFGEAVRYAREAIYNNYSGSNTWGAYQCYGDPFYRFKSATGKASAKNYSFAITEEAMIELANLQSAIQINDKTEDEYLEILTAISQAAEKNQLVNAAIIEKQACIYASLGCYVVAIEKFSQLLRQEDASFSFSAMEQFCDVRMKKALTDSRTNPAAAKNALKELEQVSKDVAAMLNYGRTSERLNLLAEVYKYKALVLPAKDKKQKDAKLAAYAQSAYFHQQALKNRSPHHKPQELAAWLALEKILVSAGHHSWGAAVNDKKNTYRLPGEQEAIKTLADFRDTLKQAGEEGMNFYDRLELVRMELVLYLLQPGTKLVAIDSVKSSYQQLAGKVGSQANRTEIANIECLMDGFALSNNAQSKTLLAALKQIRTSMEE